jgi:hypothetical protein
VTAARREAVEASESRCGGNPVSSPHPTPVRVTAATGGRESDGSCAIVLETAHGPSGHLLIQRGHVVVCDPQGALLGAEQIRQRVRAYMRALREIGTTVPQQRRSES